MDRLFKVTSTFFAIFIIALGAIFISQNFTIVGGDEGRYVQDALRVGRGEVPIADFTTRTPILLWLIARSVDLFGDSLFVYRLSVMIASAFTAAVLYLLGRELHSNKAGVVAGLLYSLTPYVLWHNTVIKSETYTILFTVLAALFLIKALKQDKSMPFLFSGICMGLAYVERHSVVSFMIVSACMVIWYAYRENSNWVLRFREILKRGVLILSGVVLGFLPVFLWVYTQNSTTALQFWFSSFIFDAVLTPKETISMGLFADIYKFIRAWLLLFIEDFAAQAGFVLTSFVATLVLFTRDFFKNRYVKMLSFAVLFLVFGALFWMHTIKIVAAGTFHPLIFLFVTIFYSVLLPVYIRSVSDVRPIMSSLGFGFLWVASLLLVYSFFLPGYPREFIPPLVLLSAILLVSVPWANISRGAMSIFVISFAGFWIASVGWFLDPRTGGWWWQQDTVNDVAVFIEENTNKEDRVFAANPLPVNLAGRRVVMDVNSYSSRFVTWDDSWGTFPSPSKFFEELNRNMPKYVLVDDRMKNHYFKPHPEFKKFVDANYVKEKSFGSGKRRDWTEVWSLKN